MRCGLLPLTAWHRLGRAARAVATPDAAGQSRGPACQAGPRAVRAS